MFKFDRIFIDMPIGLPDQEPGRDCDQELRKALGRGFSSSVFSPPCREALYAADYQTASQVNARQTGKKLSIQSWNLIPKIRQLDEILQEYPAWRNSVFESHPEWLFQLAGYEFDEISGARIQPSNKKLKPRPLRYKKKSKEGIQERLRRLAGEIDNAYEVFAEALNRYQRKDVAKDDILDAMILAVMAQKSRMGWEDERATVGKGMLLGGLEAFPKLPDDGRHGGVQRDSTGLFKAIWYPKL